MRDAERANVLAALNKTRWSVWSWRSRQAAGVEARDACSTPEEAGATKILSRLSALHIQARNCFERLDHGFSIGTLSLLQVPVFGSPCFEEDGGYTVFSCLSFAAQTAIPGVHDASCVYRTSWSTDSTVAGLLLGRLNSSFQLRVPPLHAFGNPLPCLCAHRTFLRHNRRSC